MKKCINVLLMMLMLADLVGCGKNCESKENTNMERELVAVDSNEETDLSIENLDGVQYESDWEKNGQSADNSAENQSNIDYGIEVRVDISGDGKTDRVRVVDTVSGDYAFTQVFLFKILSLAQNSLLASVKGMDFPALGHPS